MGEASLRADCSRCAALCCVALAFDRSSLFAHDKAAGTPCRHLTGGRTCYIHTQRAQLGYSGCVDYDCLGAGQLVTQEVFGGRLLSQQPDGGQAMMTAFGDAQRLQHWRLLLQTAAELPLGLGQEERRRHLLDRLMPAHNWTAAALACLAASTIGAEIGAFLRSLRQSLVSPPETPSR